MGKKGRTFLKKFQLLKLGRVKKTKSQWDQSTSCRRSPVTGAEATGQNLKEKWHVCITSKVSSPEHFPVTLVFLTYTHVPLQELLLLNSPPQVWAGYSDSLLKSRAWKGRNSNCTVGNLTYTTVSEQSSSASPAVGDTDFTHPNPTVWQEGHVTSVGLP